MVPWLLPLLPADTRLPLLLLERCSSLVVGKLRRCTLWARDEDRSLLDAGVLPCSMLRVSTMFVVSREKVKILAAEPSDVSR